MDWYTKGDNTAYRTMLDMVAMTRPDKLEALLAIAEDIQIHSDVPQDLEHLEYMLFLIDKHCIHTMYTVKEAE